MDDAKKPTSALKIESNRRNSLRSTGPCSEKGKRRVSQNAIQHGMTAAKWVTSSSPHEEEQAAQLYHSLFLHYRPIGPIEVSFVKEIFKCFWRIFKAEQMERSSLRLQEAWFWDSIKIVVADFKEKAPPGTNFHDPELAQIMVDRCVADSSILDSETLDLLLRYEAHADRRLMRYMSKLEQLQAQRAQR